jgi:hypothetical protein
LAQALRRAVERLVDGQREAPEILRRALDGGASAEGALVNPLGDPLGDPLVDQEDILQGALLVTRALLGTEEGDEA